MTEQKRREEKRREQNRTEQNRTEQNGTHCVLTMHPPPVSLDGVAVAEAVLDTRTATATPAAAVVVHSPPHSTHLRNNQEKTH